MTQRMPQTQHHGVDGPAVERRTFLKTAAAVAGAAAMMPFAARAQEDRDYGEDAPPVHYPDPDVTSVTPDFDKYRVGNSAIQRLWTGGLWLEGPAWNGVGRFFLWSDIPNDRQLRWLEENGEVSEFRRPSGNSNGNTFDWEGRQISCQHGNRQVVRYEHDGTVTVLADNYEGTQLNSPNDAVVHPDGGIWFTDPPYGTAAVGGYEGNPGEILLPHAVYRIDPSGPIERVTDELGAPNGLCFSKDYTQLYIVDTGEDRNIKVFDVVDETSLGPMQTFAQIEVDGTVVGPDAVRSDIDGNIWASAGWTGYGYDGIHCFTPEGERIGHIKLPETTSNLVFGGPKRNRLMITASQSIYAVYVNTRGAHIT
jgi:gluconolactonase